MIYRVRPASLRFALPLLTVAVIGCGGEPPTGGPSVATPPPSVASQSPAVTPPPTPTEEELAEAIDFRRTFGLKADEAWVRAVAANPASQEGLAIYGVPLLPIEVRDMLARSREADRIAPLIRAYGALDPLTWGGLIIDQQAGGVIVAQFSADVDVHRDRLTRLLPPDARFDVREVPWSLVELRRFVNEVNDDADWFPTAGISYFSVNLDELYNRVDVEIESLDQAGTSRVAEHFGNPAWLHVKWGPPPWGGPRGDLVILVVDKQGRPVRRHSCQFRALDPLARGAEGEANTRDNGRCVIDHIPAVGYEIRIEREDGGDGYITLATTTATVAANGTTTIRVVLGDP